MDETTNIQNQVPVPVAPSQSESEVVNFLINNGVVKSESSAKVLIMVLCVLMVSISLYFAFRDGDTSQLPAGAKMIEIPGQPPRLEVPITQPISNTDTGME